MARVGQTGTVIPIPQLQGRGSLSPYDGKAVSTSGVVTAVQQGSRAGFFLQDVTGDGDAATSDAIFVATPKLPPSKLAAIVPGQRVDVSGTVDEVNSFTTLMLNATGLKITDATEGATPAALPLQIPASIAGRHTYLEAREGMLASLPNAMALGPTTRFYGTTMVDESTQGPKRDIEGKNVARHLIVSGVLGAHAQFTTGDRADAVRGPLNFNFGDYELLQIGNTMGEIKRGPLPPRVWGDLNNDGAVTDTDLAGIKRRVGGPASGPLDAADLNADGKITTTDVNYAKARKDLATGEPSFTIANMNAENFFDADDAPPPVDDDVPSKNEYQTKLAKMASAIRDQLGTPDLVAMQEVENTRVLDDLLSRPELRSAGYAYAQLQTNGHRSINPTLLYRSDVVKVTDVRQVQKQVELESAANDGGHDSKDTPDVQTAPLFSREPLIVDATISKGGRTQDVTISVNHLISKFSPMGTPTDPIRIEQGKFLNGLVKDLRTAHPEREVLVIGDMNDTPNSAAMKALRGTGSNTVLADPLAKAVPPAERYSYNFKGTTQQIDHILATPGLAQAIDGAGVHHFGSDVPEQLSWGTTAFRTTDHDVPYARFRLPAPAAAAKAGARAPRA